MQKPSPERSSKFPKVPQETHIRAGIWDYVWLKLSPDSSSFKIKTGKTSHTKPEGKKQVIQHLLLNEASLQKLQGTIS